MASTLPNITPTKVSSKSTETRILIADLGDGYTQRAGDSIQTVKQRWTLEWSCKDTTSADTLIQFFEGLEGYQYFWWTPFRESSPRKFICRTWSEGFPGNSKTNISAALEEVFDQ